MPGGGLCGIGYFTLDMHQAHVLLEPIANETIQLTDGENGTLRRRGDHEESAPLDKSNEDVILQVIG